MRRTIACIAVAAVVGCAPARQDGGRPVPDLGGEDPSADRDGDGYSPNQGDCNDRDPNVHPGAAEKCDGRDYNCNQTRDDHCDVDKDGYAALAGGSLPGGDCNDYDPFTNPGAIEIAGNSGDDNCDGNMDEALPSCNGGTGTSGLDLAAALDACAPWLVDAAINGPANLQSRRVKGRFGLYQPKAGANMALLSTGVAADQSDLDFIVPQPGTPFPNNASNPLPMDASNACYSGPDEAVVHDYLELTLTLRVPTNAQSLAFDFVFFTSEYPEYVCTQYNDKFLAILDSQSFQGNVSFDARGKPVTVNVGFFSVCESTGMNQCAKPVTLLYGTGYEYYDDMSRPIGGATDWLTTTTPVTPGETVTLRFVIFDEGDHINDSSVLIDNLRFLPAPSTGGPVTIG